MKPHQGDQQLRPVSLSYSVALQALKPKSSPRRIRAGMQAPIEVSRREGEVFLLDILSHRMSAIGIYRQLTMGGRSFMPSLFESERPLRPIPRLFVSKCPHGINLRRMTCGYIAGGECDGHQERRHQN